MLGVEADNIKMVAHKAVIVELRRRLVDHLDREPTPILIVGTLVFERQRVALHIGEQLMHVGYLYEVEYIVGLRVAIESPDRARRADDDILRCKGFPEGEPLIGGVQHRHTLVFVLD